MKNGFQEALNKKDEKWSEKSHARVCEGALGCATQGGWGPLNQFIQRPQGDQLRHSLTPLRALGARWRIYTILFFPKYGSKAIRGSYLVLKISFVMPLLAASA